MAVTIVTNVDSYVKFFEAVSRHHTKWQEWYYRGHTDLTYQLVPKAGRDAAFKNRDDKVFEAWKRHAVAYLASSPRELSDWDMLAIAQHYGLATRLLDWTFNAFAAAFFALVEPDGTVDSHKDSVVFAHGSSRKFIDASVSHPFKLPESIVRLKPSSVAPRISRQGGIFTVHTPCSKDLEQDLPHGDELEKIVIDKVCKKEFAIQLSHTSINKMSLFPDLDGLSAHVNWSYKNLPY